MPVITQIYTAQTAHEAVALADLGVDHIGVTVSERGLPGEIAMPTGLEILAALRDTRSRCVALTVETDLATIKEFIVALRPDIVHLCGDASVVGPDEVSELRDWVRGGDIDVEIMQAIPMTGPESVELAVAFTPYVEWLILDSVTDAVDGIGAAGVTHDWSLSRQIVDSVSVPVILAGGLGPVNVTAAIEAVRPAGVDSLTRTNRMNPNGTFMKDLEAVRLFVDAADLNV